MRPNISHSPNQKQSNLIRLAKFEINEILPFVVFSSKKIVRRNHFHENPGAKRIFAGHEVWMTSLRYQLFATKGTTCIKCGLEGKFFALERHPQPSNQPLAPPHFNLYAINTKGEEVLITKDHIIPKSKGGTDHLNNLQTMCYPCNWLKWDNEE